LSGGGAAGGEGVGLQQGGLLHPGPRTQDPGPRTQDPGPRTQDPGPRTQDPGPRTQDPTTPPTCCSESQRSAAPPAHCPPWGRSRWCHFPAGTVWRPGPPGTPRPGPLASPPATGGGGHGAWSMASNTMQAVSSDTTPTPGCSTPRPTHPTASCRSFTAPAAPAGSPPPRPACRRTFSRACCACKQKKAASCASWKASVKLSPSCKLGVQGNQGCGHMVTPRGGRQRCGEPAAAGSSLVCLVNEFCLSLRCSVALRMHWSGSG
jgi:hypothetical protein